MTLPPVIEAHIDALTEIFKDRHAHPELGFEDRCGTDEPATGPEDFADIPQVVPGAAYSRAGHAATAGLHDLAFTLDTPNLPMGASIMARIVERRLTA